MYPPLDPLGISLESSLPRDDRDSTPAASNVRSSLEIGLESHATRRPPVIPRIKSPRKVRQLSVIGGRVPFVRTRR